MPFPWKVGRVKPSIFLHHRCTRATRPSARPDTCASSRLGLRIRARGSASAFDSITASCGLGLGRRQLGLFQA
eukprot:1183829-Prorocentrum_minimum.AAC.1